MLGFRRRTFPILLMLGAGAVLAGCGIAAPEPASTPSPSRTARPSASSTPTPTPTATAAADALVLSTAGLGPIRMGSPVPETGGLVAWDERACVQPDGPYDAPGEPYAGMWEPTAPTAGTSPLGRTAPFGLLTSDGTQKTAVDLLQVWSSEYRTPSGLHVGSTDAEVRAALPKVAPQGDEYARWYSVVSGGWRITLTVAEDSGTAASTAGVVQLISVYPAGEEDRSWWGTDVGAHCPA